MHEMLRKPKIIQNNARIILEKHIIFDGDKTPDSLGRISVGKHLAGMKLRVIVARE